MAYQREGQLTLAESVLAQNEGRNERLRRIEGLVDWSRIERLVKHLHVGERGRPAYRPLTMLKVLLLQQWYGLSDPGLEEALWDRLSFRRFAGLRGHERVPDHSTISRFRSALAAGGLEQRILAEVNGQLEQQGLVLKRGTLIDASLVEAAVHKPPAGEHKQYLGQGSALDPDAQWSHRKGGGGSHFGYKVHVAVDLGSGLIRKVLLTGAKTNDTEVGDQLICGDEGAVLADKAYDSQARRELLAGQKIADGIMRRAWWGTARNPDPQLVARNQALSKIRSGVERTFALMKRSYGFRRVRYRGLARNAVQTALLCVAINLRRAVVLTAAA
jgi:IS5 family transposase